MGFQIKNNKGWDWENMSPASKKKFFMVPDASEGHGATATAENDKNAFGGDARSS